METLMRFDVTNERNLTMLVDFYELTMANGYFNKGVENRIAYFDMYFRRVPDGGGYCIMAGVDQLIEYLNNLSFTESDIKYLEEKNISRTDEIAVEVKSAIDELISKGGVLNA